MTSSASAKPRRAWGTEYNVLGSPISPIAPAGLTSIQLAAYLTQFRLDEINRILSSGGDVGADARSSLEGERAYLIEQALKHNAELFSHGSATGTTASAAASSIPGVPANCRFADRIFLPALDYPEINFVGLLIGPRGNTLRRMENETGAKISIRGKGAQKDTRLPDMGTLASADDDLHAVVMADTQEKFDRASALIRSIVETACSTPEHANELKRGQLAELAALSSRPQPPQGLSAGAVGAASDEAVCPICGQLGHQRWECKQAMPMANRLVCRVCGGAGHIASDCAYRNDPQMLAQSMARAEHIDEEYAQFMQEIGGAGNAGAGNANSGHDNASNSAGNASRNPWASGLQADEAPQ